MVGALRPGANADLTVLELRDGNLQWRNSDGYRQTPARCVPEVEGGRVWYECAA
jgi:predicted amidohydrolase